MKATFDIELLIPLHLRAISCAMETEPVIEPNGREGIKLVRFERTPAMATYALYLGVGEFRVSQKKDMNLMACFFCVADELTSGEWTLDIMIQTVRVMERHLGVLYPLPKIDFIHSDGSFEMAETLLFSGSVFKEKDRLAPWPLIPSTVCQYVPPESFLAMVAAIRALGGSTTN